MARTRLASLCCACVCAVVALTASSALATENLPKFGKCFATAGGKYKNSGCTKLAGAKTEEHKFEWEPLTSAVPFTAAKEKETLFVLEAAGGIEISCSGEKATGEYDAGNLLKNVVFEFSGCKTLGAGCLSEGQPAERIRTKKLHGEPGIVTKEAKEEKNIDGVDLRAEEGENLAEFSCGPGTHLFVRGGVVSKWQADSSGGTTGQETNKMLSGREVEYVAEKPAKQIPEEWTPNGEGVSNSKREKITEHLEISIDFNPFEGLGFALSEFAKTVGKVKIELRQCESNIVC